MYPEGTAVKDEGTHRDIINRAKQQVSMGVTVDLGFSLKHHGLIIQWLNYLWLLLRGKETQNTNKQIIFFELMFSHFCLSCTSGKLHTPLLFESC